MRYAGASATHAVASLACPNNEGLAQRETRHKKHNGQVIGVDRAFGVSWLLRLQHKWTTRGLLSPWGAQPHHCSLHDRNTGTFGTG